MAKFKKGDRIRLCGTVEEWGAHGDPMDSETRKTAKPGDEGAILEYGSICPFVDFGAEQESTSVVREEFMELLPEVGDAVRVKRTVSTPAFRWGPTVTSASVGVLADKPSKSRWTIDFPGHKGWSASPMEIEVVEKKSAAPVGAADAKNENPETKKERPMQLIKIERPILVAGNRIQDYTAANRDALLKDQEARIKQEEAREFKTQETLDEIAAARGNIAEVIKLFDDDYAKRKAAAK